MYEFLKQPSVKQSQIKIMFGSCYWSKLVQAAELEPNKIRKINDSVFEVDIETHVENYKPRKYKEHDPYPTMNVISDIHWPFSNKKVIDKFLQRVSIRKPEWVIINGDAWDMYSHSKFARSHNIFTPREEQASARKMNEDFWQEVQRSSPHSKCVQLMGNHDIRPLKRVLESYPEAEDWITEKLTELFSFPNVRTIMNPREELIIGDIAVFHGYRSKLGEHRDFTMMNCINGHTHLSGVSNRRIRGQTLWEANSGLAGDPEAKGLTYTPQKITNWTPSFLEVDPEGPRIILV